MKKSLVSLSLVFALIVSLLFTSVPSIHAISQVEMDPVLTELLETVTSTEKVTAIVTFDHTPTTIDIQLLKNLGLETHAFKQLPMIAVRGLAVNIKAISTLSGILSIYSDKQLDYFLKDSVSYIEADRVWNDPNLGFEGEGVTVAVIDSGIDATHPDLTFGEKTIQNVKFLLGAGVFGDEPVYVENVQNTDTSSGHGTHVAGTIAGTGAASDGLYKGVAPKAKLVGLGTGEALSILWALEGFDYALANKEKYDIGVISNSWGTTGEYSPNDPINVASKKAHDAGMVVVFASGNEGPDDNTLNPYSVAPWVIGVAAGTKDGKLADFSSRGVEGDTLLHPTITAPGVDIVSARSSTGTVINALGAATDATYIEPAYVARYTTSSGTSMATPHMAGVIALMLSAKPDLHPDLVKNTLTETATPMLDYKEHQVGSGYVQAYNAVTKALRTNTNMGKFKDPKSGKVYPTYSETYTWSGTVGLGAADAGIDTHDFYDFNVGQDAVNLIVRIDWTNPATDLDLFVRNPLGTLGGKSAQGVTTFEETTIPSPVAGTWTADTHGYLSVQEPYTGTYTIEYILK